MLQNTPHPLGRYGNPILGLPYARSNRILPCNVLHPVGGTMPSQTIHIPKDLYQYVLETEDEDQSTSDRVRELMEIGKEVEQDER